MVGIYTETDRSLLFLYLLMTCLSPPLTPICSVGLHFLAQGLSLTEQMDSTRLNT